MAAIRGAIRLGCKFVIKKRKTAFSNFSPLGYGIGYICDKAIRMPKKARAVFWCINY
jgi:hypothetical protein